MITDQMLHDIRKARADLEALKPHITKICVNHAHMRMLKEECFKNGPSYPKSVGGNIFAGVPVELKESACVVEMHYSDGTVKPLCMHKPNGDSA